MITEAVMDDEIGKFVKSKSWHFSFAVLKVTLPLVGVATTSIVSSGGVPSIHVPLSFQFPPASDIVLTFGFMLKLELLLELLEVDKLLEDELKLRDEELEFEKLELLDE